MVAQGSLFATLLAISCATSALTLTSQSSANNVSIIELGKNRNSTGGEGHVAAAGSLSPFGAIGIGCGVNWDKEAEYGGGLQAGSNDFGLGGGYKITPTTMEIGAGIGINTVNATGSFNFMGSVNGTFELRFESSLGFTCVPSSSNGVHSMVCTTYV